MNLFSNVIYSCGFSASLLQSSVACVTNDRSEARVDPLAALIVQGQTSSRGIGGNVEKAESKSEAEQWVRAGGRQTERITIKQARSERQAANDQERRSTVQVVHGKTNWEKRSEM